jgi:hypothetical protein
MISLRTHPAYLRPTRLSAFLMCCLSAWTMLASQSPLAQGQQRAAPAPPQAPRPAVQVFRQVQVRNALQARVQLISDQQFDSWVFREDHSAEAARRRQESLLTLKVEELDRVCRLNGEQKQKMQLSGQGDIKRFFDSYERLKEKTYVKLEGNGDLNAVFQETNPLATRLQSGLFGAGSLFQKSMAGTLEKSQFNSYQSLSRERLQFRHNANIELLVSTLEESVPLPSRQRRKLLELLRKETRPAPISGNFDFYYLMWQTGKIPEEKLRPLFDDAQWRAAERFVTQYMGIEPTLRQAGYFARPDSDVESSDGDASTPNP